jgi:hypothetical protein
MIYVEDMAEKDAIERLREMGFDLDFSAVDGGLKCNQTGKRVAPEDARILHTYRFEGQSSPGDEAIVYGIETASGKRGILVDAYGPYASPELASFIDRIPIERVPPRPGNSPPRPE